MEVYVDDETKLTLHGLQQYYVKLKDQEKNRKLFDLLDVLEFNQVSDLLHRSCERLLVITINPWCLILFSIYRSLLNLGISKTVLINSDAQRK